MSKELQAALIDETEEHGVRRAKMQLAMERINEGIGYLAELGYACELTRANEKPIVIFPTMLYTWGEHREVHNTEEMNALLDLNWVEHPGDVKNPPSPEG